MSVSTVQNKEGGQKERDKQALKIADYKAREQIKVSVSAVQWKMGWAYPEGAKDVQTPWECKAETLQQWVYSCSKTF